MKWGPQFGHRVCGKFIILEKEFLESEGIYPSKRPGFWSKTVQLDQNHILEEATLLKVDFEEILENIWFGVEWSKESCIYQFTVCEVLPLKSDIFENHFWHLKVSTKEF